MTPPPPPKGGSGRSRLFGRPDALLVGEESPRIAMPPPPPPVVAAAPAVAPMPTVEEPVAGEGPARVFIGVPGTAPPARIATPTWDEDTTDERAREEEERGLRMEVSPPRAGPPLPKGADSIALGLDRSALSPPGVKATSERKPGTPSLRLAASLEDEEPRSPRAAAPTRLPREDSRPPREVSRPVPWAADADGPPRVRVGAPPLVAPPVDADAEPTLPYDTRSPAPPPPGALWENLPESEPAPRPVVPVRRQAARSPDLPTPTPVPRAAPVRPATPEAPRPPVVSVRAPAEPPRAAPVPSRTPMPLTPPAAGSTLPQATTRRELPSLDQRREESTTGGLLPWVLLAVGIVLAGCVFWWFQVRPYLDAAPPPPPAPVEAPAPVEPEPAPTPAVTAPDVPAVDAATPPVAPPSTGTPTPAPETTAPTGVLIIQVTSAKPAKVYVDGKLVGTSDTLEPMTLAVGEHTVRAVAGRNTQVAVVRVDAARAQQTVLDLTK